MNKRLENKITKWYGNSIDTRVWIAKHWHRWITYGCSMCWTDKCDCSVKMKSIKLSTCTKFCFFPKVVEKVEKLDKITNEQSKAS